MIEHHAGCAIMEKLGDQCTCGAAGNQMDASQGPGATVWCNSCLMNPANGCRHPLGPSYCPYRSAVRGDNGAGQSAGWGWEE